MYPEEVAGIILVDSSHENQLKEMPKKILSYTQNMQKAMWFVKSILAPVGALRLLQQRLFVTKIKEAAVKQKLPDAFILMGIANHCKTNLYGLCMRKVHAWKKA